jgi:hypothetical protein
MSAATLGFKGWTIRLINIHSFIAVTFLENMMFRAH